MTGYGSATGRIKKGRLFCEIKTINHRYCEISLRIPNRMSALESKIRDHLKGRVERGKIDIFMKELDPVWGGTTLMADVPLARQYQRVLGVLQKSLHLNTSANLLELIGAGTFIHSQEVEGNYEKIWSDVRRLFDQALKQVETMRRREGAHLLADQKMRVKLLKKILAGKKEPLLIPRLEVSINQKKIPFLGLNDLLFACRLQGETARYTLQIGHHREFQKSSGIWVATGAGSTAALFSAGGKPFSMTSRKMEYWVREPFQYKIRYRLLKGFVGPGQKITILPDMSHGIIFIDGGKIHYHVPKHARVTVRGGLKPLKLFL